MWRKSIIVTIVLVIVSVGLSYVIPPNKELSQKTYTSRAYGISFSYPAKYFTYELDSGTGERIEHMIILIEDTPENRSLIAGERPGTEGPPVLMVGVYQNNLDMYTTESFVRNTNFSNFKLSDGVLVDTLVGGEAGLQYHSSGLYEHENVVVAQPGFVYMFSASFNSSNDQILADFREVLDSVIFSVVSTSSRVDDTVDDVNVANGGGAGILPFNSGVTGRVLFGPICPVMKNPPDPDCVDKPYVTAVNIFATSGSKSSPFAVVATDKEGTYKAMLPSGMYSLYAVGGKVFPQCEEKDVIVEPEILLEINLSCDTGIR